MSSNRNQNSKDSHHPDGRPLSGRFSLRALAMCGFVLLVLGLWLSTKEKKPAGPRVELQKEYAAADSSAQEMQLSPKRDFTKPHKKKVSTAMNQTDVEQKPPSILPMVALPPPESKQDLRAAARKSPVENTKYVLEDGLAVIHGDMVVGVPVGNDDPSGYVKVPDMQLWIDTRIPFYISDNVPNPQRIYDAFELFVNTPIKFIPWTDQEDAIVFEVGTHACKSYVGRIGGKQPIWLSGECSAKEVAHEILHALGFVHEQNRMDRDKYINVLWDNIEEDFVFNFELLPERLMKVSMAAPFDFNSLMIYSPYILSKNAKMTMTPINNTESISPGLTLSDADRLRLKKVYGDR